MMVMPSMDLIEVYGGDLSISLKKPVDFIGGLTLDFCQQDLLLLHAVPINLKFWQSNDIFRLMAQDNTKKFKLHIADA
jgi:hypothetical protein